MIAIVPIGGAATRIYGIPKYLLPTTNGTLLHVLLGRMHQRVIVRETLLMSKGFNTAILQRTTLPDAMIVDRDDISMSHACVLAREYALPNEVASFGMPDSWFDDELAFLKLAVAINDGADVAVGLFAARDGQRNGGMCAVSGNQVAEVIDKPASANYMHMYPYIWGVLAWRPTFWDMLRADEPHVGYALPRAIEAGLDVRAVVMDGGYWDCGTVEGYFALINHLTEKVSV